MASLHKEIDYSYMKENGLDTIVSNQDLQNAIQSNEINDLREYIFNIYNKLIENHITIDEFYYGEYVYLSYDEFDMFSYKTIESIFRLFGYKVELLEDKIETEKNNGLWVGKIIISKDVFSFEMKAENSMHNKLISLFIDTKTAKIIAK